jgi:hypothetical protein
MTKEEAQQVLDLLRPHWPQGARARFFVRNSDTQEVFGCSVPNAEMLAHTATWAENAKYNCYIQLNPTFKPVGTRCSAEDITHWCWFLLDIDPVLEYANPSEALERAEAKLQAMLGLNKLHRVLVDSGRGLQAWYPLGSRATLERIVVHVDPLPRTFELEDVPIVTREVTIGEAAPRVMGYWLNYLSQRLGTVAGCQIDTSVSDLSRVMRLPFTVNQKTGRRSSILERCSGVNVSLADKLLTYAPYSIWKERMPSLSMEGASWHQYLPHMTRGGRMFLTEGQEEPGRHRAASSAMLSLLELGCQADQIKAALRFGGSLCTPTLPPSETDVMVERRMGNVKA